MILMFLEDHWVCATGFQVVWGMVGGNVDANNVIDMNDKSIDWSMNAGEQGYRPTDFNMDGQT